MNSKACFPRGHGPVTVVGSMCDPGMVVGGGDEAADAVVALFPKE
ncbi:MAG: hypothetical protein QM705_04460 [Ancrocorticia sp.]